ncbi:hypothetical protein LguiA_029957 [Lonicera macranthoides]
MVNQISKTIQVQVFPGKSIKHNVYGTALPQKDLLIGFDIIRQLPGLRFFNEGLRFKNLFLPWLTSNDAYQIQTPILEFPISQSSSIKDIKGIMIQTSYAESHTEFLQKCSNPLWKNSKYFVRLPFKLNEDVNLTKAFHSGMNLEHLVLAVEEVIALQQQQLIEATTSQWACEAFYVNKRSEQVRGKMRLVINYQPLNHFLLSDKFPLPQKHSMFSQLTHAKVFFKFDLKASFWQLGISLEDRHKTAFCIPGYHYQ